MLIADPEYSKSVGGVCIGYSDKHIAKLLDDSRVQLIIGFHDKTNDPDKRYRGARYAKNYNGINEAVRNSDGKTIHIGFNRYVKKAEAKFHFDADQEIFEGTVTFEGKTYEADDIPRLAADMYLADCRKKDYTPAYNIAGIVDHPNYYKLLADFSLYDSQGHYAPHRKVAYNIPDMVPNLDANGNKQTMPTEDYIRIELEKELAVRDSIAEALADESSDGIISQFKAVVRQQQGARSYNVPVGEESAQTENPYAGKKLYEKGEVYDYDFMIAQKPMVVATMPNLSAVKTGNRVDQKKSVDLGLKNAASIGRKIDENLFSIRNFYTNREIQLGSAALAHGLDASNVSRLRTNARLVTKSGEIIKNAIPVNGLKKDNKQAKGTYAMAALVFDGHYYVVAIVTVDEFTSRTIGIEYVDIAHAINGRPMKKTGDSRPATGASDLGQESASVTAISTISIADFLEIVNSTHRSILSDSVLQHFNENRPPEGHYSTRVLFKLPIVEGAAQHQAAKDTLTRYKEALRDQKNDTRIMEQEFARIARVFETQARRSGEKDVKIADLKEALAAEARKHKADQKLWEAEFNRLLREYDTAGRKIDKLEETVARQRQAAKEKVEGRRRTEMRHKIMRFKEKLQTMLQRPTDNSYVPVDLIGAMVDVCELIDTDSPLYKADGSLNKAQAARDATRDRLIALKDEYSKLKTNSDPIYAGEFDEMIEIYLDELRQKFTGKSLQEMSLDELREMYEILRGIDETLQDARQLIDFGEKVDVYEAGDAIIDEQIEITDKRKEGRRSALQKAKDTELFYTMSPVRNVERMSGYHADSFLVKLFHKFEQGIRKKNKFMMDAYKSFEKLTAGKEYEASLYNETGGKKYVDVNGRSFGISKMQMMQAILSYEREVANGHYHIQKGGFTFADLGMLKKGGLGEAISEEYAHRVQAAADMVSEFMEILKEDAWAQQYMAAARSFFNGMAKDAINETSVAWKHRIVAKEKSYIPYEVDKNFVLNEISAANSIQETINAYGMLKATKDHAPQPLIVTGLNNVLDRHIERVGSVYGLAIPVRNFNKVWNMRSNTATGNPTVKAMMQKNWGLEGVKHIEQAVQDIQGKRESKNNFMSNLYRKVKSNYIGATFLLNLSVVTKQIGSLFSATSMLRWRDPARMVGNLLSTMAHHKKIAQEVDRYTATAWMRKQGVSDAELHSLLTEGKKSWIGKLGSKLPAPLSPGKWTATMDYMVALSLWKYAKIDTAKRTGLQGEELLQATATFYDDLIENTQSMSDVLHRPEVQKHDGIVSNALGMFKTDLYQMAGQLRVTAGRFAADRNGDNGRALARTVYGVAMSAVWGQLMTTLFALLRYKVNSYRDEEDKDLTVESWLKRQGFALAGDLTGYLFPLLGSETIGLIENVIYGENEDFLDSLALTAVNDLIDTMTSVASNIKEGEAIKQSDQRKLVTQALQVFGVPANNILRFLDAVRLHAQDIANGEFLSFEAGAERSAANHVHRIAEEVSKGNMEKAKSLYEDALEDFTGDDAADLSEEQRKDANSKLQSAIGTKYKDGEIIRDIAETILLDLIGQSEDDVYWIMDRWDYARVNGDSDGYTKYDDFHTAVQTGVDLRKVVKEYTDNGVSKQTLKSQVTAHFKPLWLEMTTSEKVKIKGYLINAFVLLGDTREEAIKKINKWQ